MKLHQLIPKVPSKSSCSPFQIILAVVRTRKEGILFRYVPSSTPLFFMLKICQCLFIWLLNVSAGNKTLHPSVGFFRLVPKIVHRYISMAIHFYWERCPPQYVHCEEVDRMQRKGLSTCLGRCPRHYNMFFCMSAFQNSKPNNSLGWKISEQFWHTYRFASSRWSLL